jgi:hypothetical protein
MSNKKQTAVEWLVSNISSKIDNEYWCNQKEITEWVEKAKEIEKVNLKDAWHKGYDYGFGYTDAKFENSEQYYKETYEQ